VPEEVQRHTSLSSAYGLRDTSSTLWRMFRYCTMTAAMRGPWASCIHTPLLRASATVHCLRRRLGMAVARSVASCWMLQPFSQGSVQKRDLRPSPRTINVEHWKKVVVSGSSVHDSSDQGSVQMRDFRPSPRTINVEHWKKAVVFGSLVHDSSDQDRERSVNWGHSHRRRSQ
jgi:hypothetical protein